MNKKQKRALYNEIRSSYQLKRRSAKWRKSKRWVKVHSRNVLQKQRGDIVDHIAPKNFSLIKNTDEVLEYFNEAEKLFKKGNRLILNINDVEELTPDSIALYIGNINDRDFHHNSGYLGDAPKKPELKKLFTQSGFYNFVNSKGFKFTGEGNLLHKEMHHKVVPSIAMKAAVAGIRHTFETDEQYEPIYDILIECMSNTNNHASLDKADKCNWWLYVYNEPDTKITSYSFLDLGVGIFESIVVQNYLKRLIKGSMFYRNINIVDDLLNGKIQSRLDEDNEIRGKGIPQIVEHSKLNDFKEFYIISNDVKVNLKTSQATQLKHSLSGTFLYWELQPKREEEK